MIASSPSPLLGRRDRRLVASDVFRRLCRARDLLHAHYDEQVSVAELAGVACLSEYHFLRTFRRAFGRTPHQYQVALRIEAAKRMLSRGDASVTETCMAVGFSSLGSFSSRFGRDVGLTPRAYRQEMRRRVFVPGTPWEAALPALVVPSCYLGFFLPE